MTTERIPPSKQMMSSAGVPHCYCKKNSSQGQGSADLLQVAAFNEAVGCLWKKKPADEQDGAGDGSQAQGDAPAIRPQVVRANVQTLGQQNASHYAQLEEHGQRSPQL